VRSFVAVDIGDAERKAVADLQRGLKHKAEGVRWVRPDRMHLTLAFLGEVSEDFVESAKPKLADAVRGCTAFDARLGELGAFSSPRKARVVWVGMTEGKDELCSLQKRVVAGLRQVGFEPERRGFSPHLTLGRLRVPADVSQIFGQEFKGAGFRVDRVILFQSVLKPEGPEYSRLAEFELSAARPPA
jgi:2'-5' RNA ligase